MIDPISRIVKPPRRTRAFIRSLLRPLVSGARVLNASVQARRALRNRIRAQGANLRIVIGASGTEWEGWVSTEYPMFDVTDASSVQKFLDRGTVTTFLAEHVWEHLTPAQATAAVRNCHALLKPGGRLRIAVPDGLHPDPAYIEYVRPGGTGVGSDDHKVFYCFATLSELLESAGFEVRLLEWFDENGVFHFSDWSPVDGMIVRSTRYDERNRANPTAYTSLIVDGIKAAGPGLPRSADSR